MSCCFSSPAALLGEGGEGYQLPPVGQMLSEAAVCLQWAQNPSPQDKSWDLGSWLRGLVREGGYPG